MSALDNLPTPEELAAAIAVVQRAEKAIRDAVDEAGLPASASLSTGFWFDGKYTQPRVDFRSHEKRWSIDGRRAYSTAGCLYRRDLIEAVIAEGAAPKK